MKYLFTHFGDFVYVYGALCATLLCVRLLVCVYIWANHKYLVDIMCIFHLFPHKSQGNLCRRASSILGLEERWKADYNRTDDTIDLIISMYLIANW